MSKPETHDTKRREFLRGSALLGAGATLVAGAPAVAASAPEETAVEPQVEKKQKGYRLTKHISAYYRTAAS
ncbi:MAG: hypothetical protein ACPGSM_11730 [Thiolinea sp.]